MVLSELEGAGEVLFHVSSTGQQAISAPGRAGALNAVHVSQIKITPRTRNPL